MARSQGKNKQPLSVTCRENGVTEAVPVSDVVKLFDPKNPYSLLQKYRGETLFAVLMRVSPTKLLQEKLEGLSDQDKETLVIELQKMWWKKHGHGYEYQEDRVPEETV